MYIFILYYNITEYGARRTQYKGKDMDASRKSILKLVFGIAIPILIMIVTMVMVGMSFAWFTDADKVTIESITMSTAEAYRISFARQNELCNNLEYMGQTALTKDGYLMSKAKAGENTLLQNDRAYYFVNAVSLDTLGKMVDFRMSFDGAKIYQVQKDENGNVVNGEDGKPIVTPKKTYGEAEGNSSIAEIPYAFTWFFTPHVNGKSGNYTTDTDNKVHVKHLDPNNNDVWYTPYGKLEFKDGKVAKVNGQSTIGDKSMAEYSIKDVDGTDIVEFQTQGAPLGTGSNDTSQLFDFYVVFAPEKLFWMQYFAKDCDTTKVSDLYGENVNKATGGRIDQMYYASMGYSGCTFEFSAIINVIKLNETTDLNG